ncbi:hypothetical protein BDV93DRAFT_559689 [Ceratobasidium sp. AG-I]|nr:hypothetical protein BDV93DRAFT_559689 [Ceratobasidium sp. AG-I]
MAKLLAYFAIKLFSIVPNSMTDERTVSTFTWLNSALRNHQDVATVVRQTQIRQFYGWDEEKHAKIPSRIRYHEIHKQGISKASKRDQVVPTVESGGEEFDDDEFGDGADSWLDEPAEPLTATEVLSEMIAGDLVDLDAPELEDCLSNTMPARLVEKQNRVMTATLTGSNGSKAGENPDEDSGNWDF